MTNHKSGAQFVKVPSLEKTLKWLITKKQYRKNLRRKKFLESGNV